MKKTNLFRRVICIICTFVFIASCFTGCKPNHHYNVSYAMGSMVTATIYTEDDTLNDSSFSTVVEAISETENALSGTKINSELYSLNEHKMIYASDNFIKLLSDSVTLCNIMERRVDISIGKVTKLWGFNTDTPSLPSDEAIKTAVEHVGVNKIVIDEETKRVIIDQDIELDFGALGKGAACDAVYEAVKYEKIPMILSIGGTVFAYREPSSGKDWKIGIRDPYSDSASHFAVLRLGPKAPKNAVFVSTSGSYEKSFTENGKAYHHILDPKTGYPVENELISVTVVASSGLNADALSTFFFINGFNAATLSYLDIFDCDAVFVFKDKTYYVTEGLRASVTDVAEGYTPTDKTIDNEK